MLVKRRRKRSLRDEIVLTQNALNDKKAVLELENKYLKLENEYRILKEKLVSLLLPEQIEAAKTCNVTPEFYALEWIDIYFRDALTKESNLYKYAPDYAGYVKHLSQVR
jgi:hypothetical protein